MAKISKYSKKDIIYILPILVYVLLLTLQINMRPFERYPEWDHFWVDVRTAGTLSSLKYALMKFELPIIDPYTGFGWNLGGNHYSFWNPVNTLILLFPPDKVIVFNQIILLILGGMGAYRYLSLVTRSKFISFVGGLCYISIPYVISLHYYDATSSVFYCVPFLLFLIHKILERQTSGRFIWFVVLSAFAVSSSDIHSLIVFPTVIFAYSFIMAYFYYGRKFLESIRRTIVLIVVFALSASFYIVPLYNNLRTIGLSLKSLKMAGVLPATYMGLNVNFISFVQKNRGFESLYWPIEGSALVLYIPAFFYAAMFFTFVFWDVVFKNNRRQISIVGALIFSGILMFLGSLIFYSPIIAKVIPSVRDNAMGVLRAHINLIPFVNLLAGFVCFSAINESKNKRVKIGLYILIIIASLLIDLGLFTGANAGAPDLERPLGSSNRVGIPLQNMSHIIPWINVVFAGFLISLGLIRSGIEIKAKNIIFVFFVIAAMLLPLLGISVYNEWFAHGQQGRMPPLARSPYQWNDYIKRKECIDNIIDRHDLNYRTLYAGSGRVVSRDGRDKKLIAETEMHVERREKALFSYREIVHPYTGLMRGTFKIGGGGFQRSNIMPPLSKEVPYNINSMKLMGIKWVISADEEIDSPHLIYRGKCYSEEGPGARLGGYPEGGSMFIYEIVKPNRIVFLVDNYKKAGLAESLRLIYENKEYPWNNNVVFLEKDPTREEKSRFGYSRDAFAHLESKSEIKKETFNSIEIIVNAPKEKYLILSYIYRPNWKAYVNSQEVGIYRAYGGFMCVEIPPGKHIVTFKYSPVDTYLGILMTSLAFLAPVLIKRRTQGLP